jgi:hypothetical protein
MNRQADSRRSRGCRTWTSRWFSLANSS